MFNDIGCAVLQRIKYKNDVSRRLGWDTKSGASSARVSNLMDDFDESMSELYVKKILPRIFKKCPACGKRFFTIKSNNTHEKTVCSKGCANTYFKSDENSHRYKTGEHSYRERCYRHWPYECAIPKCNWKIFLEVHHIDGNRQNNKIKNLIPLCPNHHSLTRTKYKASINIKIQKLIKRKFGS